MISVIVPTYNQSRYLARAIESVWAQDLNDVEIIVVDDGSTDDTEAILQELSNQGRLRYFRQENQGPAAARNRGIRESRGELIAFLDSDDFWLPGKLKAQLNALARTGDRFSYCGSKVIDENESLIALAPASTDDGRFINLVWGNRFATPTVLVQRSLLDEVGLFDESLRTGEDWDLWLRLASKGPGACVSEPLAVVLGSRRWQADEGQFRAYEHSMNTVLARIFGHAETQPELTALLAQKERITSWHFAVLAKSYLNSREFRRSLRYAAKCIASSPRGLIYLLPITRLQYLADETAKLVWPREVTSQTGAAVPVIVQSSNRESVRGTSADFSVSVVIRTYNRAGMLGDALNSVLGQTLPPAEVLVVDDGSTDETAKLMESYLEAEKTVRYIQLKENVGMDQAGRIGVEQSSADYVAFLDSDDVWLPTHLEECLAEIERNPGAVMVFSGYGLMTAEGRMLIARVKEPSLLCPPLLSLLCKRIVVQPTRTVFLRRAIMDVGGMPLMNLVGDWVLNVLIAARFLNGVVRTAGSTALFRIHGSQSYSRPSEMRDSLLKATDYIFNQLPEKYRPFKRRVVAINLLHSAAFLWQAGELTEGWQSLFRAVAVRPLSVTTREFWIALVRLVVPPSLGRLFRGWKRSLQERRARNSGTVPTATNTA